MGRITPYLKFNGKCAEAMEFYKSVFGGELTMQKVGETPMAASMPAETHDMILHADLTADGIKLFGSDLMDGDGMNHGNTVVLTFDSSSFTETKAVFDKLAVGGKVGHQLENQFFGAIGDLVDQYGFSWFIQSEEKMPEAV